ncbi:MULTISPECIES: hypothetical protein [Yersinia]|uniref:Secreted protein n=1 Tax=Yersinia frederiksenii TaxID=29484 RepID=A0AAI9ENV9_YERFR|nr:MULTISPECIES: hypothetical protein [Yersinia]MDN0126348.1 hypothetical protein [Yersinia massiliensis]CFQ96255.1 Uncharacterised protein [Yersinia frederiksenii]
MTDQLKNIASVLLLSIGLLLPLMNAAQAEGPLCAKPVFYAQTLNHNKEVEICIDTPHVSYSFGKTGATNKEMDITVPAANTTYAYQSNQVISIHEFTVRNGETRYQVSTGTNDEGEQVSSLYVFKGAPDTGKLLAEIKLDPHTVVNNISHALVDDGIAQADGF